MRKAVYLSIAFTILMAGCGGTQYRDASEDKGSMRWGPREIKTTVNKMVGSLYGYLKDDWKKSTYIQVKRIKNKTAEHIDTGLLAEEIVNNLIKRRIKFVDEQLTNDTIKEIEKGMTGMVDPESAIPAGELQSPNLYLYGNIRENVRYVNGKRLQYLVVTLKLKELRTGMQQWQDRQEFLKATKTDRISF
jgi:uncharacterized protein (TIGR02722 family)